MIETTPDVLIKLIGLVGLLMLLPGGAHATGDVEQGRRAFLTCAICHTAEPGRHKTGPSLANPKRARARQLRSGPVRLLIFGPAPDVKTRSSAFMQEEHDAMNPRKETVIGLPPSGGPG